MNALVLFLGLMIDRFAGDPDWLWGRVKHPVVLFGKAIEIADKQLNHKDKSPYEKRRDGFVAIAGLMVIAALAGFAIQALAQLLGPAGLVIEAVIASIFLAQKSLLDHVAAVANGLRAGGLEGGRKAVAMIVGRDPQSLDESGVSRAAIESLAENSSDGVIAPAFWLLAAGLPGLFAYKMLNTADSMIGHMNDTYRDFGRASAKFDDAANWIPARVTGFLLVGAGLLHAGFAKAGHALSLMLRDARLHRSPNAGWPEAAMAGMLGLALAGPRIYAGDIANEPMLNASGRREAGPLDIDKAIAITSTMFWIVTAVAGVFILF
ncbi:MAG: adenosylcobinamide-phosphate synthase CbiB [Rhizobiaceae bacterium]